MNYNKPTSEKAIFKKRSRCIRIKSQICARSKPAICERRQKTAWLYRSRSATEKQLNAMILILSNTVLIA